MADLRQHRRHHDQQQVPDRPQPVHRAPRRGSDGADANSWTIAPVGRTVRTWVTFRCDIRGPESHPCAVGGERTPPANPSMTRSTHFAHTCRRLRQSSRLRPQPACPRCVSSSRPPTPAWAEAIRRRSDGPGASAPRSSRPRHRPAVGHTEPNACTAACATSPDRHHVDCGTSWKLSHLLLRVVGSRTIRGLPDTTAFTIPSGGSPATNPRRHRCDTSQKRRAGGVSEQEDNRCAGSWEPSWPRWRSWLALWPLPQCPPAPPESAAALMRIRAPTMAVPTSTRSAWRTPPCIPDPRAPGWMADDYRCQGVSISCGGGCWSA